MTLAVTLHLVSVVPAMLLGIVVLANRKGTPVHKLMGRVWVGLMLFTSLTSFFIQVEGSFSWIHILSVVTIFSLVMAVRAIRRGDVNQHKGFMQGAFIGAAIAGFFAAALPGRIVYDFLFG